MEGQDKIEIFVSKDNQTEIMHSYRIVMAVESNDDEGKKIVLAKVKNLYALMYGTAAVLAYSMKTFIDFAEKNFGKYGNYNDEELAYWTICFWAAPKAAKKYIELNNGYDFSKPGIILSKNFRASRHEYLERIAKWRHIQTYDFFSD